MAMMTAAEAIERAKGLTFEKVWAMFEETDRKFVETDRKFVETDRKFVETDRKFVEQSQKTNLELERLEKSIERFREEGKEIHLSIKRMSENIGGLNRSIGELVETLIAARLWEKFPQYNLKRAYQRVPIYAEDNQVKTDIDILLVDTTTCMAIEVKRELDKTEDVDKHIKRMSLIRQFPPAETVGKQLLAAMAGGIVDADVKDYAYNAGFFVLELTGESVSLIEPPKGFEPRKW